MELPSLQEAAQSNAQSMVHAANLTAFFRELGAKGRSPVEFQVQKATAGDLKYSRRDPLIDYLLYAEVLTGFLVGLHDRDALAEDPRYGLAEEAAELSFEHISGRDVEVRPTEPVLIAGDRIVASLRHGPDRSTRITNSTSAVWGVMFASPDDDPGEVSAAAEKIVGRAEDMGIWSSG